MFIVTSVMEFFHGVIDGFVVWFTILESIIKGIPIERHHGFFEIVGLIFGVAVFNNLVLGPLFKQDNE